LVRKNAAKPSKIDEDLPDISVLSYEDTELIFTLFYCDILNLCKCCTLLLLRVATIGLCSDIEDEKRRNKNCNINKIYNNADDQNYRYY
jgi:hypothetical protein